MDEIRRAVEAADYFTTILFHGTRSYDKGNCDSLLAARNMGERMELAANNGRRALVYAVCGSQAVLVPRDFR